MRFYSFSRLNTKRFFKMVALSKAMAPLPDSLIEIKEYCSNCGKEFGKGGSYVRATIEQVSEMGETLFADYDKRYFCKDCLKGGIYINVKDPETNVE
jgi:hypothetical protein